MRIIEGDLVDLITPFPRKELKRVFGWLYCYKSIIETDAFPKTPEEYEEQMSQVIPNILSYAVIDKNNITHNKHETPLVGMFAFEPMSEWNAYIHLASSRSAWKKHLMDEAARLSITDVFSTQPFIRLSGFILEQNLPVRYMAKRMGWTYEGLLKDWVTQNGVIKDVIHYGYTRAQWLESQPNLSPPAPVPDSTETTQEVNSNGIMG
jgi:RimJ/RimL family protein N-acetyltransferase